MTLWIIVGLFTVLVVLRVPIVFALATAVIAGIAAGTRQPLSIVVSQPIQGIDSFVYLAIPLFIFAGGLMEKAGISKRLIDLAEALVGWLPGGLALAVVVATIFFSGISGSKLAEAGAMGVAIFPRMAAAKYPAPLTVGVVAAASAMGEMVPPAILMIVLATLANQSVAQLFAACLLPALLMSGCLMAQIFVEARRLSLPRVHFSWTRLGATFIKALPALTVPVVVIGGLISGLITATEGGAAAVVMVLTISLVYRELRIRDLPALLLSSARTSGAVLFLVAIATSLSFVLAFLGVPQAMVALFLQITQSPFVFMLFSAVILILFGSALESVPAALIFMPVFLPVTDTLGISPIQYLVVVVGALGIGLFLPPLGVGSIMLAGIAGVPSGQGAKQVAWLLLSVAIALILIMLIPEVSLILPSSLASTP